MSAIVRAKVRVGDVLERRNKDGRECQIIKLYAVSGGEGTENGQWSKWTPSLNLEIQINNPAAFDKLENGCEFYLDFIPVETEA
jgi:hypothetical protein